MHVTEPVVLLIKLPFPLVRSATVWISVCAKTSYLLEAVTDNHVPA
jgi:hypothetical protein